MRELGSRYKVCVTELRCRYRECEGTGQYVKRV